MGRGYTCMLQNQESIGDTNITSLNERKNYQLASMAREAHQDAKMLLRCGVCLCAEKAKNKLMSQQIQQATFEVIGQEWHEYKRPNWKSRNYCVSIKNQP